MPLIEILETRSLTTIQDLGRHGYRQYGVPVSGPMDDVSSRLANYLVGNDENAPLLEFAGVGPVIEFKDPILFSMGGWIRATLNGDPVESWSSHFAEPGDVLDVGTIRSGVYGYIAFSGGIKCAPILGSCSTYVRARFGRPLKGGDKLKINPTVQRFNEVSIPNELLPVPVSEPIRVLLGPDLKNFTEVGISTFLNSEYEVTKHSDRMGYRLRGPKIEHSERGSDILTDALPLGAVQVPANGNPIVMMADGPTTGGYPRIAVVASVDLPRIAQTPPGGKIRFRSIKIDEAQELFRRRERGMAALKKFLQGEIRAFRVNINGENLTIFLEDYE